jgi:hypothetical protein
MMKLYRIYMLIGIVFIVAASTAQGGWIGPTELVSATWGQGAGQVGLEPGDSFDRFPRSLMIGADGEILIADVANVRVVAFNADGGFASFFVPVGLPAEITGWPSQWTVLSGSRVLIKGGDKYQIYNYSGEILGQYNGVATFIDELAVLPDDSIIVFKEDTGTYYRYSSSGQLLQTLSSRPLELGKVKSDKIGDNKYRIAITYPERVYGLSADRKFMRYVRDTKGFVFGINAGGAWRFNQCGKLTGAVLLPSEQVSTTPRQGGLDAIVSTISEYGEPVVPPSGDVYTWKRTPDKYSILKWTWVDDPNTPSGPDAPTGLTLMPSISGLYLTWTASPNDPGCVTGYEIYRATSAGGVGSTIGTVNVGILKYNDTTATAGTTYYYKVRAVAGSEFSPYTSEVNGKR